MKQTKHFKRTALSKSAKSMVSLMLLLIAMLMPQGVWATDFISEIKVSVENGNSGSNAKRRLSNDGYQIVNVGGAADLNGGAGGSTDYVYIGYKTSTNAADAITGLLIVESSSDPKFDAHAFDNITNANVIYNGKNYYRCDNYKVNDDGRLDCDLNRHNSKGADIVLFYTKDGNTSNGGTPLTSITVVGNTTETGVTYTRHWQYGTAQNGTGNTDVYGNTNQGNGTAHYITYTTHTHAYTAAFNWATNGKSCTATTNCADCGDTHSNLACTVTSAPKSGAAATCTVMGWTTYTAKITSNGKEFSASTDRQDIAALGHGSAGYDENYSWSGNAYNDASKDTKACTFTLTCKKCSTKVVNGASLTCTKTAHVDASCTATGSTTYQATGSYTAANSAYNYSATKTNVYTVAALGHGSTGYTDSYSWTGNAYNDASKDTKACMFTLTCKNCSTKVVNGASLTCIKTAHVDATCRATGSTTYLATGSYTAANSAYNYSATKTNVYTVAALGHGSTGYTPTYTWGGTYDAATCTFTLHCGSCGVEVFNDNITTTKVPANHVDATCGKDGNERWTATGSYSKAGDAPYNGEAQAKDYSIPATGLHTFDDETDPYHTLCTVCDHSFFRYTSSTGKAVDPYDANELKGANGAKLDFTNTYVDGHGVMEFKGTLKTIGYDAFYECSGFTGNLTIPNSVTSIGYSAFEGCKGFTGNLTIPNSVTSIGTYAFYECSGFDGNLTIPNSVTSIGISAFSVCSNLTGNLTIPNSVTSIGNYAFYGCSGFTGVEFQSVPQRGRDAFDKVNCPKTVVLSDDSYVYTGENPYFPAVQSATYTRRGIKNQWGTIVVPFMVNGSGADYDLYKLDQVYDYELTLTKVNGTLAAGTPVLIRLHDDLDGNYDLTLTAASNAVSCQLAEGSKADGYQLVGTYETKELSDDDYFISNNKFWSVGEMVYYGAIGVKTAPFRAYLRSSNPYFAKALSINIAEEDVTAVETLNAITEGDAEYYDMNGRRIPQLQKGINIVKMGNGKTKKVILK